MSTVLSVADAGLEKANGAVVKIGEKLSGVQADVAELRHKITHLTLAVEIDDAHAPELAEARSRLALAEQRTRELSAAEQLARDLAQQAKQKALDARRDADWSAARQTLDECLTTARALDDVAKQLGGLYRELRQQQADAVRTVGPHLGRIEHQISVQPPNLDVVLKLVLANAGGPMVAERDILHLSAEERRQASVAAMVEQHGRSVLAYRTATTTEQKESDHE
jgi:hypothetical protein